jgi:hypothetical protein
MGVDSSLLFGGMVDGDESEGQMKVRTSLAKKWTRGVRGMRMEVCLLLARVNHRREDVAVVIVDGVFCSLLRDDWIGKNDQNG